MLRLYRITIDEFQKSCEKNFQMNKISEKFQAINFCAKKFHRK